MKDGLAYGQRDDAGNAADASAMTSPQLIGIAPQFENAASTRAREDGATPHMMRNDMQTNRPEPNAELTQRFEPLRVGFALLALLLGALASLQF